MSADDYACYWHHYVWPSWRRHGAARVPHEALRIACTSPTKAQARELLATGWFGSDTPRGAEENRVRVHVSEEAPL